MLSSRGEHIGLAYGRDETNLGERSGELENKKELPFFSFFFF